MKINFDISVTDLNKKLEKFWDLAAEKAIKLDREYDPSIGSPVFTAEGTYTTRGWTEWTQGFQYGIPLLVFDVTGSPKMLEIGKRIMEGDHYTFFSDL